MKAHLRLIVTTGLITLFSLSLAQAEDAPTRAGHYYLHGIHEVGSELLLKPDQSYEWFLSYGALDQQSKGTWREAGGKIILTAEKPAAAAAFFELKAVEPWSDQAADAAKRREDDLTTDQANAFCPFLTRQTARAYVNGKPPDPQQAEDVSAPPQFAEQTQDTAKAARKAVAALPKALAKLHQSRKQGLAAIDSFQQQKLGTAPWAEASNALLVLMKNYEDADQAARETVVNAAGADEKYRDLLDGDDFRPLGQYAMAKCEEQVKSTLPKAARAQLAIFAEDPDQQITLKDKGHATLHLSNGTDLKAGDFHSGFSLTPLPEGQSVKGLSIELTPGDEAQNRHADFELQAQANTVIHIIMHVAELLPPTFETLELPIEGDTLKFERGQYEKDQ